jgi:hypothetical protein
VELLGQDVQDRVIVVEVRHGESSSLRKHQSAGFPRSATVGKPYESEEEAEPPVEPRRIRCVPSTPAWDELEFLDKAHDGLGDAVLLVSRPGVLIGGRYAVGDVR